MKNHYLEKRHDFCFKLCRSLLMVSKNLFPAKETGNDFSGVEKRDEKKVGVAGDVDRRGRAGGS
jgi:hypothetical protein